jgi:hypothetical protein
MHTGKLTREYTASYIILWKARRQFLNQTGSISVKECGTMNRPTLRSLSAFLASAVVALSAAPFAVNAQEAPFTGLSVDQVRNEFVADGYQVGAPIGWWTNNHITTFTVTDGSEQNGRVAMVLVYPDAATAESEVAMADQSSDPAGPHLVPGYGPALVRDNVAIVESTQQELNQRYATERALQDAAEFGTSSVMPTAPTQVTKAVDADFLSALDASFDNL